MTRNFAAKAVHKYMYPATYTFRDDADGAEPTGWTTNNGANCTTTVIASLDGHRKVLKLYDPNGATGCEIALDFGDPLADDVHEFWIAKSSIAVNTSVRINFYEGATRLFFIRSETDDLQYYDGAFQTVKLNYVVADTLIHIKIVPDDSANTMDIYVDGIKEVTGGSYDNNSTVGIEKITITTLNATVSTSYIDAWGTPTRDANYNIGDNCFWRHYGESTDSFEGDDIGTTGTSITWVDTVDTAASFKLVQEFNEHKKILRANYSSGVGGADIILHYFATQSKNGWFSCWFKAIDVTINNLFYIRDSDIGSIIRFRIENTQFQIYTGGAWRQATGSPTPVNDTWYHIYIQWYDAATDTFDLFIDNVQYEDGTNCENNQVSGINRIQVYGYSAGTDYTYIDAPISSLDSDSRGDNRIFDYNDAYTREDITTTTQNVFYSNVLHQWRTATLLSNQDYEQTVLFFQIYDTNSKLAMEAEISNRIQNGQTRVYTLLDKNQDDLLNLSSNTFSADDIHDPTDSTCMLKTVLPNVSEADGDLILVNADTKTDTYSTVTKNYPDGTFLQDISDLSDSVVIIEGNGKCHLDDDLASGDALDFDTAADHSKMLGDPQVNDILDTINYFEVFGAINPDTGERFYKITDNSGTDRKRKWRITNNSFRNQTDLDAYAAKLVTKLVSVKEITISVQGLGAHDMGTLFTYKFDNDVYTIPSAAYYIIKETIDFDTAAATIVLSEGLVETSKYASRFEKPQNYQDIYASEIYDTEIVTVYPSLQADTGSGAALDTEGYVTLTALNERMRFAAYFDSEVDVSRDMTLTMSWQRKDINNDTLAFQAFIYGNPTNGGIGSNTILNDTTALPACALNRWQKIVYTLPNAQLDSTDMLDAYFNLSVNLRSITIKTVSLKYFVKRVV